MILECVRLTFDRKTGQAIDKVITGTREVSTQAIEEASVKFLTGMSIDEFTRHLICQDK